MIPSDHDIIIGLTSDVSWLKWAVGLLYPLILINVGVNLFGRKK